MCGTVYLYEHLHGFIKNESADTEEEMFHFDMESATRPAAGFQKLSNQKQIDVQGGGELKQLVSHRARGQIETKKAYFEL